MTEATDQQKAVWARERGFHDALAAAVEVEHLPPEGLFDRLDAALLALAGDSVGSRVLDVGCGQGDLTLRLLHHGAQVTALDLSPGMIELVRRRVEHAGHPAGRVKLLTAPLEHSGLPDSSFDVIVGKYVLHHLDLAASGAEVQRLLRPGGRAVFVENSAQNPLLMLARRRLAGRLGIPRLGTVDEHPLTAQDIAGLQQAGLQVRAHYPVFEFFAIFDRQVLRFRWRHASRALRRIDDAVYRRAARLRRYSFRVVVELLKAPPLNDR